LVVKFKVFVPLVIESEGAVVEVAKPENVPVVFAPAAFVFMVSTLLLLVTVMVVFDAGGPAKVPVADAVVGSLCVTVAELIDTVAPPPWVRAFEDTVPISYAFSAVPE
jgi:hypothetical protein